MSDPARLADEFAAQFEAGGAPDPREFLDRADEGQRQELESLIDRYLMTAPRRRWDPVAYESSEAKAAVDRVYESLEGVSGSWPELLPALRNKARVKRSDLVRRLADALGAGTGEREVERVGGYYHQMEHGLLPAEGVSARVIDALAAIVGASAEAIRAAGEAKPEGGGGDSAAFARLATPAPGSPTRVEDPSFEPADAETDGAAPDRDEIDRLFTED